MKTRLLLLAVIACCAANASAQQIQNGGFENWTDQYLFTQLDEWNTSNGRIPGVANVTQVQPAPSGSFAAHLETIITSPDTLFGLIIHGDFLNDVPTQGVPFTTEIDAVEGWYRYDLQPNDSALIVVGAWSGGSLVLLDVRTIGGSQPAWAPFNFPLTDAVVPDSVIVAVTSSNPFASAYIQQGSWIDVDALRLTSPVVTVPDQLPNYDMENWTDMSVEEPDGWGTFNAPLFIAGLVPVTKSMNAHGGSYSARLESFDLGGDTLPGAIANNTISFTGAVQGEPFSELPLTLDGWFLFEPSGADTALIFAQFSYNGIPVGSAVHAFTGTVTNWTPFSAPVNMIIPPDTMLLVVFSGGNPGSVLHLDDLSFDGLFSEVRYVEQDQAFLFPNPASDQLTIHLPIGADRVRVIDAVGRVVVDQQVANAMGTVRLAVDALRTGRYVVEVVLAQRTQRLMFVKQ